MLLYGFQWRIYRLVTFRAFLISSKLMCFANDGTSLNAKHELESLKHDVSFAVVFFSALVLVLLKSLSFRYLHLITDVNFIPLCGHVLDTHPPSKLFALFHIDVTRFASRISEPAGERTHHRNPA